MNPIVDGLVPEKLRGELLRLYKLDKDWVKWEPLEGESCRAECPYPTWVRSLWIAGQDAFALWAVSAWIGEGPKVFKPTAAQCQALEQIEVNLELSDYAQPYPALLVLLPAGRYEPFESVLCVKSDKLLICNVNSTEHLNDIITTVAVDGRPIETSLQKFDDDLKPVGQAAAKSLRVAVNACLALVNFGAQCEALCPKKSQGTGRWQANKPNAARERGNASSSRSRKSASTAKSFCIAKKAVPNGPGSRSGKRRFIGGGVIGR